MRIGLAGAGRSGAFHASTLAGLDQVDQVVGTDGHGGPDKGGPGEAGRREGGGGCKVWGGLDPGTPWGQPTRGYKTRNNKCTDAFSVNRRGKK